MFGMGKSTAKQLNKETSISITFKDVAGCDEAKVRLCFLWSCFDPRSLQRAHCKPPFAPLSPSQLPHSPLLYPGSRLKLWSLSTF